MISREGVERGGSVPPASHFALKREVAPLDYTFSNRQRNRDVSRWLQIDVERTLTVDRGRDAILCDRSNAPQGETLVVLISPEAVIRLRDQINSDTGSVM